MKSSVYLVAACCLALLGCKKPKQNDPASASNGTTNTTPSLSSKYYGQFTEISFSGSFSGTTFSDVDGTAYFSGKAVDTPDSASAVQVDSVSIDGTRLTFNNSSGLYESSSGLNLTSHTWRVKGNNGIPDMVFTSAAAMPAGISISNLPDTIRKAIGINLTFNVTNATSGIFVLSDGGSISITQALQKGVNTISISASKLSGLTVGSNAIMFVLLTNTSVASISGKTFQFVKELELENMAVAIRP